MRDLSDDAVGIAQQLDARGQLDVARVDNAAGLEVLDVDDDLVGQVLELALDGQLGHGVHEQRAGGLEADSVALEHDVDVGVGDLVEVHTRQVAVNDVVAQVVELHITEQDGLDLAVDVDLEDALAALDVTDGFLGIDGDGRRLLAVAVDNHGQAALLAETLGVARAEALADLALQNR